jgi:hypothetical protein
MNSSLAKPLTMGLIAGAIDQFYLQESSLQRTAYFAGAVAVGNYASEFAVPIIKHINLPTLSHNLYDSKTLMERIVEVGSSSAMIYVLNKYLLNNDIYRNELMLRLGIIAVSDVGATYLLEYLNNQKLEFLTDA